MLINSTMQSDPQLLLTQQDFLRSSAKTLGLTQKGLAERMRAPWSTLEKWLLPTTAVNARQMPEIAWQLVREIIAHEKLKSAKSSLPDSNIKT